LPASEVVVHGKKDYLGIVGAKPPHMMTSDEYSKTLDFTQLYVDVGMTKEQAEECIGIGAYVTFKGEYCQLQGDHVASKAMDDRASLAVLFDCADKLADCSLGYDLYICACVQEEVGLRGARTAAYSINPDLAIAIDVTHATTPDESKGTFKCGSGPVVCLGPNIHNALVNHFIDILKRDDVSYEIEVEGGNTGTDAWSIQTAREGIPTMLISLAVKYMHTPIETISLADCIKTSDALVSFLKSFEKTEDVLC
ncbi:MAG: M42 family peptidase, partial [Clostridia bacterium]|nr:M42 family peptidase [Clostridia bacterium]